MSADYCNLETVFVVFPCCYLTFTVLFLGMSVIRIQGNANWLSSFLRTRINLLFGREGNLKVVPSLAPSTVLSTLAVVNAQQGSRLHARPTPSFWNGRNPGSEKWVGKFLRSGLWISSWMGNTTLYHISNMLWVLRDSRINYWSLSFSSGDTIFHLKLQNSSPATPSALPISLFRSLVSHSTRHHLVSHTPHCSICLIVVCLKGISVCNLALIICSIYLFSPWLKKV